MEALPTFSGHVAGASYLLTHSLEQRRSTGRVYTPPHIVQFVLEQAGYRPQQAIDDKPLLDPACGAGAFLEQAVAVLLQRLQRNGTDYRTRSGFQRFLKLVEEQLWAVDSDERSCEIARNVVSGTIDYLTGHRPPEGFFRFNVLTADFLLDAAVEDLPPIHERTLAFLVGNPPYVPTTRLSNNYKERLRNSFQCASGRIDLYTVFVERALALLPERGRLALITPDKFLTSYSARALRSHVLQTSAVRSIALFQSHKVFGNAATVPCVTVLEKGAAKKPVAVRKCISLPDRAHVQIVEDRKIDHFEPGAAEWRVASHDIAKLVTKLQSRHPTLREATYRISAGPATGRDGVFVFPTSGCPDVEPELLRPAIRGRDIDSYSIRDSGLSILLPYTFDGVGTPALIRLRDYPRTARFLDKHREELSARHCVRVWGKAWYEYHDQPAMDLTTQPKILVPDVANSNRFAVDSGSFPLHSAYYILAKPGLNLDYLAAVLNSSVAAFLIGIHSPLVKDGFQRYRQQFLMSLPIPLASATDVRSIAKAVNVGDSARADELVQGLFGLNEQETTQFRSHLFKPQA
jgi:hypothetical protein